MGTAIPGSKGTTAVDAGPVGFASIGTRTVYVPWMPCAVAARCNDGMSQPVKWASTPPGPCHARSDDRSEFGSNGGAGFPAGPCG